MAALHRKTLARILGLFVRKARFYFRLNDFDAPAAKEGEDMENSIPEESRELERIGGGIIEFESAVSCESFGSDVGSGFDDQEELDEDDSLSETSTLGKYFDPYTSILRDGALEPSSPAVATWERRMDWRIHHGRGLGAWIDWVVDRGTGWFQMVMERR